MTTSDGTNSQLTDLKVLVFIPSRNDWSEPGRLVGEIRALGAEYTALVIDDGSERPPKGDFELISDTLYVSLPSNYGLGVCTQIAFDHAEAHGYHAVARIDADGQHPVSRIPDLVRPILDQEADLVIGCRINAANAHDARGVLTRLVHGYFRTLACLVSGRAAARDLTSGFLAFGPTAVSVIGEFDLERYPEPQINIISKRAGLRVKEIEIEQRERATGSSTLGAISAFQLIYRFSILVLAELLRRRRVK